jgi:hypothetical protein
MGSPRQRWPGGDVGRGYSSGPFLVMALSFLRERAGSLGMFAAIRRDSSRVSRFITSRGPHARNRQRPPDR